MSLAEEIAEEVREGLDVTSHYEALKKGGAKHTPSEESWADKLRGFFSS